jgi:hypothetical protein
MKYFRNYKFHSCYCFPTTYYQKDLNKTEINVTRITQMFYRTIEIKMLLLIVKQIVAAIPHPYNPFGQCITPFKGEVWRGVDKIYSF